MATPSGTDCEKNRAVHKAATPFPPLPCTLPSIMAFLPSLSRRKTSHEYLAERALRRPSSTIWLNHVCVSTTQFEKALGFYVSTLGLSLRTVELDPTQPSRMHAILVDAEDRDVLELVEADGGTQTPTNVSQLGFCLPRRSWQLLRARLDTHEHPYRVSGDSLVFQDTDGIVLRVQPLGEC